MAVPFELCAAGFARRLKVTESTLADIPVHMKAATRMTQLWPVQGSTGHPGFERPEARGLVRL